MESSRDTSHVPAPTRVRAEGGDAAPLHRGQCGVAGTPWRAAREGTAAPSVAQAAEVCWWQLPGGLWPARGRGAGGAQRVQSRPGWARRWDKRPAPRRAAPQPSLGPASRPLLISKGNGRFPKLHKISFSDLIPEPGSRSDFNLCQTGLVPRRWAGGVAGERSTRSANLQYCFS